MKILHALILICAAVMPAAATDLVILHTNDTHSNIDPDSKGAGGILQRKAVIDSVRNAEKNVILIDAGDMVQGTLFFKFFRGDVEYPLFNMMDYDVRVLGNHEFDNGMDELAAHYADYKGARLSANYDFSDTPLKGMFQPYVIRKIGGKKIGIFALNVDPESLIAADNTKGLKFRPIIRTGNEIARMLKHDKKCDVVIAVTHIGYANHADPNRETDVMLAAASKDIDMIIGGHSHTLVDPSDPKSPSSVVNNAEGKPVLIAQTGRYGRNVGEIRVRLDKDKAADGPYISYRLIPVTDRFPAEKLDKRMIEFLKPFRAKVDSINSHVIAKSMYDLNSSAVVGGYPNFAGDFGLVYGRHFADSLTKAGTPVKVDLAIMNTGGIRQHMPVGDVTEGQVLATFPFSNRLEIIAVTGKDLVEAMKVAAARGGEAVSGNVRVVLDQDGKTLLRMIVDGEEVDPDRVYNICTIDYLAGGNDGMRTLANGKKIWQDDKEMSAHMLRYISRHGELGLPIAPDRSPRFVKEASPVK